MLRRKTGTPATGGLVLGLAPPPKHTENHHRHTARDPTPSDLTHLSAMELARHITEQNVSILYAMAASPDRLDATSEL
jgi:hypothetical protein